MPEVANASAVLFDPLSPSEITRAMRDVLLDAELRLRMERLGSHRASHFTWSRAARETLGVYYEVAGARQPVRAALSVVPR
jgi:glycosyltransferase involved in cell wall biosynthesis